MQMSDVRGLLPARQATIGQRYVQQVAASAPASSGQPSAAASIFQRTQKPPSRAQCPPPQHSPVQNDFPVLSGLYGRQRLPRLLSASQSHAKPAVSGAGASADAFYAPLPATPVRAEQRPQLRQRDVQLDDQRAAKRRRLREAEDSRFDPLDPAHFSVGDRGMPWRETFGGFPGADVQRRLATMALSELSVAPETCSVCDELFLSSKVKVCSPADLLPSSWNVLSACDVVPALPHALRRQYIIDHPLLRHLLLSPRGVRRGENDLKLVVCNDCLSTLKNKRMPPCAVANGFAIGSLPLEFASVTPVECALVAPVQCYSRLIRLQRGEQLQIKGHVTSQKMDVQKVANALPWRAEHVQIRVLITSAFTSAQRELALKDFEVNRSRVRRLLLWLQQNSCLYAGLNVDEAALMDLPADGVLAAIVQQNDESDVAGQVGSPAAEGSEPTLQIGATMQIHNASSPFETTAVALRSLSVDAKVQTRTYTVRSSSEPQWDNEDMWFVGSHPTQLPFGRGGPNEARRLAVSAARCYEHYSRLSTRQFQDAKFALHMYDSTASRAMKQEVWTRATFVSKGMQGVEPGRTAADAFGRLSVDELRAAVRYNDELATAQRLGHRPPVVPQHLSEAARTFIATAKTCCHPAEHSVEHAHRARQNLFAMGYALGPATWWLTIAPDDVTSVLLYDLAKGQRPIQIPMKGARWRVLADHPAAAAMAFERMQAIVIKYVLGWDTAAQKPYRRLCAEQERAGEWGGMLGVCRAFAIANETQARGSLHMHILLWTEGIEQVAERLQERASADETKAACEELAALLDRAFTCELSVPPQVADDIHKCADSKCRGELHAASDVVLAKLREPEGDTLVKPLICSQCSKTFHCKERINAELNKELERVGLDLRTYDDDAISRLKWRIQHRGKWDSGFAAELEYAVVQNQCNVHFSQHTHTCWKKQKTKACRFRFPQVSIPHTSVQFEQKADGRSNLNMAVRRRPAFAYVAQHAPEILRICLTNNNLQFVKDYQLSFYVTMYATKVGREEGEANAALLNAFRRNLQRVEAKDGCQDDLNERKSFAAGVSQMMSSARGWTATDTVSAQAAAFFNLKCRAFVYSHAFAALPLQQGLLYLQGGQIETAVGRGGISRAAIHDYVYRPQCESLASLCWYDFVEQYEVRRTYGAQGQERAAGDSKEYDDEGAPDEEPASSIPLEQQLLAPHPLRKKRVVARRSQPTFVTVLGKRLGDLKRLEADDTADGHADREAYGAAALILFRPFRALRDLKSHDESWWQAYNRAKHNLLADEKTAAVLRNMQLYHHEFTVTNEDEKALIATDDIRDEFAAGPPGNDYECELNQLVESDSEETDSKERKEPAIEHILKGIKASQLPPMRRAANEIVSLESYSAAEKTFLRRKKGTLITDLVRTDDNKDVPSSADHTPTMIIERVRAACASIRYSPSPKPLIAGHPERAPADRPTIVDAAQHWTLNEQQHYAFVLLCSAILDCALKVLSGSKKLTPAEIIEVEAAQQRCLQLSNSSTGRVIFGFITGAAGTGKSRVIDAALDFARRWDVADTVAVTATSGAAAALISAQTWQSAVGLGIEDVPRGKSIPEVRITYWLQRGVMIIDEIGMAGLKTLSRLDARLRQLKRSNLLFGGVHVLVFGDFKQLKPVGDLPLFQDPQDGSRSHTTKRSVSVQLQTEGYDIWRKSMNAGVELSVNVRASQQQWYADLLERFARNQPTASDLKRVNERVVRPDTKLPHDVTVVVPLNTQRMAINNYRFDSFCEANAVDHKAPGHWRDRGAIVVNASIDVADRAVDLSGKATYLRDAVFTGTKNGLVKMRSGDKDVSGRLKLILGSPVMVLNNDQTSSGIVNGTMATVVDVVLSADAVVSFNKALAKGAGAHAVEATHVCGLILRYADQHWASQNIFESLPAGCFPLRLPQWRSASVLVAGRPTNVRVRQFNCTPAFALTGNKVQGATLSNLLVASWRASKTSVGDDGWIYVVLSRVRHIEALSLLEALPGDPKAYAHRADVDAEMARLRTTIFKPTMNLLCS